MTDQQRSCPIPDLVVNVCPTSSCISCAGIYTNQITGHKIVCQCNCHSETLGAEAAKLLNDKDVSAKDGQAYHETSSMTSNHIRVYKHDLAAIIERMAFDTPAAHDIHLRFDSEMIWDILSILASPQSSVSPMNSNPVDILSHISSASASATLSIRRSSKDLVLP